MNGIRARFELELGPFGLHVDFAAPGTGLTALFGPSGAGKTTVLRCLAGLERAPRGRLEVNDAVWQDSDRGIFVPAHRRGLGYVRQEAGLFPHLSVRRNQEYGLRRTPPERKRVSVEQAIGWLGIGRLLERRPEGLSGGERRRVAIARALLAGPRLLLMDEPLTGLDDPSRHEILPYLERLHRELAVPVFYVSHSRSEVLRLADFVVLLDAGRVHASGPVERIATRPELAPFGAEAEIGAVTEAVVVERDEAFGLSYLSFPGGRLGIPSTDLRLGERRRLRLLARDVSLALERPRATSILNVIPVRVIDITEADGPLPLVRLDAGGTVLLARITRRSLHQLEIRPGLRVYAQIKSVALLP